MIRNFPRLVLVTLVTAAAGGTAASLIVSETAVGQGAGGPGTTTETTPTRPTETTPTTTTPTETTPTTPTTDPPPTQPPPTTNESTSPPETPAPPKAPGSIDDLFASISKKVPTFAGMYLDAKRHRLMVRVVGGRRADAAKAARLLRAALRDIGSLGTLRVVSARYSFADLQRTYAILRRVDALEHDDVVSSDIDEKANRLTYGVTSDIGAGVLAGKARTAGVDPAMVRVKRVREARPQTFKALNAYHRPVIGGLGIYAKGQCTGFPAVRLIQNAPSVSGFITSSHCTNRWRQGFAQPSKLNFYQPQGAQYYIGKEDYNPKHYTGFEGCPLGTYCRYSDTAFIKRYSGTVSQLGVIARPTNQLVPEWEGDKTYRVIGVVDWPAVGQNVVKVGQSTGLTYGKVTATCKNEDAYDYDNKIKYKYLCQANAEYYSDEGDSGSPVFGILDKPLKWDVKLIGVHRAGVGGYASFSSIGTYNAQDPDWELGPLKLCASSAPAPC